MLNIQVCQINEKLMTFFNDQYNTNLHPASKLCRYISTELLPVIW